MVMKNPDFWGRGGSRTGKRFQDFIFLGINGYSGTFRDIYWQLGSVRISQSELVSVIGQVWFKNAII